MNQKSFNSTMVRLKDSKITQIMSNTTSFQFHYGTIKRLRMFIVTVSTHVSIPLWYD